MFFDTIFHVFLGVCFSRFFCDFSWPKAPKRVVFGVHVEDNFGDRLFVDFCYPYCTKPSFLSSGGYSNCIDFGNFLEGALRNASGIRFGRFLIDFGVPGGYHLVPKTQQKKKLKKKYKSA